MKNKVQRISNPFPPVADENARVLILGSLPSEASRAAGFYYMNPRNRFWSMMTALLGEEFTAMNATEKAAALTRHRIALSDVISSCEIHRSSDASIKAALRNEDITAIFHQADIKKVLLNGGKAHSLFLKYFPEYKDLAHLMPSTSPANARLSLADLIATWKKELE